MVTADNGDSNLFNYMQYSVVVLDSQTTVCSCMVLKNEIIVASVLSVVVYTAVILAYIGGFYNIWM